MQKFAVTASVAVLGLATTGLSSTSALAGGDWSGFHVDGHVDAGWMRSNWSGFDGAEGFGSGSAVSRTAEPSLSNEDVVRFRAHNRDTGWGGGVGIGYNWQFDNVVLGAIADWTWLDASDSKSFEGAEGGTVTVSTDVHSVGTVRGILGFAGDRVMPYVTAGWAWGSVDRKFRADHEDFWGDSIRFNLDANDGWTAGGGIAFRVGENTSINAEVLYVDFGSDSKHVVHTHIEDFAKVTTHMTLARIGLQFHF